MELDQQLNLIKKLTMTSCRQIISSSTFFLFMADSEQSRSRIPRAWSAVLKFSLKATIYLTKTENRIKKSLTLLSYYCFEQRHYFCQKIMATAKLRWSWYYNVFFLKLHMCLYLRTKFQVSSKILTSFWQRGNWECP